MQRAYVLITGGAEFIGINVAYSVLERDSVRAIPMQPPLLFPCGCPKVSADQHMLWYSQYPELLSQSPSQVVAQCASC